MKKIIIIIISLVVVGGGSFYGGMKYADSKSPQGRFLQADFQDSQRLREPGVNGGGGFRGGLIVGEIISQDDKSITLKIQDGGSKIVFLSDSMEITKSAEGALSDLEIGKNITVNGAVNSDGSIAAQSIQLRPEITPPQQ